MSSIEEQIQKKMEELRQREMEKHIEMEAMKRLKEENRKKEDEKRCLEAAEKRAMNVKNIMDKIEQSLETKNLEILIQLRNFKHSCAHPNFCSIWTHENKLKEYIEESYNIIVKNQEEERIRKEEEKIRKEQEEWENVKIIHANMSDEEFLNKYLKKFGVSSPFGRRLPTREERRYDELLYNEKRKRFGESVGIDGIQQILRNIIEKRELQEKQLAEKRQKINDFKQFLLSLSTSEREAILNELKQL